MPIDLNDVKSKVYFVHLISRPFMNKQKHHTTTVLYPHEYSDTPVGCVGLYSFNEDKSILLGIMNDGAPVEITMNYFPQHFLQAVMEAFKHSENAKENII